MRILSDINEIDKDRWHHLSRNSDYVSLFQTPAFFTFLSGLTFLRPFVFGVESEGNLQALVCGYCVSEKGSIKSFFSKRAIIPGGVLLVNNCNSDYVEALLSHVSNQLKAQAVIYIEIRNYIDYSNYRDSFIRRGFNYSAHYNIHLYTNSLNDIELKMKKSKLRGLKAGKAKGNQYHLSASLSDISGFYQILKQKYDMDLRLPLFPFEFFEKIIKEDFCRFFVVKINDKVLGGSICVMLNNKVIYEWFVCGQDKNYPGNYISTLATWAPIEYACHNNFEYFDFMGAGKPDVPYGVRDFKLGFGGELVEFGRYINICNSFRYWVGKFGLRLLKLIS